MLPWNRRNKMSFLPCKGMQTQLLWVLALSSMAWLGMIGTAERTADAAVGKKTLPTLAIGAAYPKADLLMRSVAHGKVSLAKLKQNKGLLVVFSCNHCPYVKAWDARLAALGNRFVKRGIGVIAVNANNPKVYGEDDFDGMKTRAKKLSLAYPYAVDPKGVLARAFGAYRTPEVFLFGKDGTLVYHGAIDDNASEPQKVTQHYLADALEAVAQGKKPPLERTPSVGCGIAF